MSRAVVTWAGSGRPEALRNTVLVMPSSSAVLVMRAAKADSDTARFSLTAAATSLADLVTTALMASSTVMVLSGLRPSFDGAMAAARFETFNFVSSLILPTSRSWKTR